MKKSSFASDEDILNISKLNNEGVMGIPFIYNNEKRVLSNDYHTLVISEDSIQKNNRLINPLVEQAINFGESFIINSIDDSVYKKYSSKLMENEYEIVCLNFDDLGLSDGFNLLELAYNLYKDNKKDKAIEVLENISYYIFMDKDSIDKFWSVSASNLFIGSVLYLFENSNELCFDKVKEIANSVNLKDIENNTYVKNYLESILKAPVDTKGGIVATFEQKINLFVSKKSLSNLLFNSTYGIKDICNNKIAIFIIEGVSKLSKLITSMYINQVLYIRKIYGYDKKINIIIDNFDDIFPIKDIEHIISILYGLNINLTVFIKNFTILENVYGKESFEILKLCFKNLVYLYSNDILTLEYISKLCGSLEYISSLRSLKEDEALFIIIRTLPFKVNLF